MEARTLMSGVITSLTNRLPDGSGTMMLQTDGSVLLQGGNVNDHYYRLAPDASGNYQNATVTQVASTSTPRLYFGSNVLPDGRVFVIGGEYSGAGGRTDDRTGEIYNPQTNTWKPTASFPKPSFGDDPTALLPDGTILAGYLSGPETYIYNPTTDVWTQTGTKLRNDASDEETWVKLADGSILSYDVFSSIETGVGHAQRYIPATKTWIDAGIVPVSLSNPAVGYELGGALLLPDGRVFVIGATDNTAYYTPSTNTWTAGPKLPGGLGADDAPVAELPNGKLLLAVDTPLFKGPTHILEFDPPTNVYTDISASFPNNYLNGPAYIFRMVVLPTGQVLVANGDNQLTLFTPTQGPLAITVPKITTVAGNSDGSYTLTGTLLNGLSEGASYGDDVEMSSNFPIVSFTDASNKVFYGRTYGWTGMVATGSTPQTTKFQLPVGLPANTYRLRVIANGSASLPFTFTTPTKAGDPAPTIATAASANPNPTTTATTRLTFLAADTAGESTLVYNWSSTGGPAGIPAPSFATNNNNAAKSDVATFYAIGTYNFKVTATNLAGLSVSSTVTVVVQAGLASFSIAPNLVEIDPGTSQQYTASALDQFGNALSTQPAYTWTISGGGGTITSGGLYTAPASGTIALVTATSGQVKSSASVYVLSPPWVAADIGAPDIAGIAGDNGSGTFTILSSGDNNAGDPDQFRYVYKTLTGDGGIIARVLTVLNTNDDARAGVVFRTDTSDGAPEVSIAVTPSGNAVFQYRTSANGSLTTVTKSGPKAPYFVKLTRTGNSFSGFYSSDGVVWVQEGTAVTIAMPSTIDSGLFANSNDASVRGSATFNNVFTNANPVIISATATPNPVTTTATVLQALGSDQSGESTLKYNWSVLTKPVGALNPTFSINGTNASKRTVATFTKAGDYAFQVTVVNAGGLSSSATVYVSVVSTLSGLKLTPASVTLQEGGTQQFTVGIFDQFGIPVSKQPYFTFSIVAGGVGGKVSSTGLYTAPLGKSGIDYLNVTGGAAAAVATIFVTQGTGTTNAPARIASASVASVSTGWGSAGSATLVTAPDGVRLLPIGRKTNLPWLGLQSLTITLSQPVALTGSDVSVTGLAVADYGPVTVSRIAGTTSTYVLTLGRAIASADRVTVKISNPGLNLFLRRLDVLPGDVNDDGVVDAADATLASSYLVAYNPSADLYGEGKVTARSVKGIQLLNGTRLMRNS